MINAGRKITDASDRLTDVTLEYLVKQLKNPKPEIEAKIRQLRIVRNVDAKRYSDLKRSLPYLVCAHFSPPYRKTDNFAYTEYFFIDVDHIAEKELNLNEVREKIEADERTVICFTSPSEDGIKILFKLSEKCYDHGKYSIFYKNFTKEFSMQYNLEQVVDSKTCDVCRACFISFDKNTYYNPNAKPVDISKYIDIYSPNEINHIPEADKYTIEAGINKTTEPESETIEKIKGILKLNKSKVQKAPVYVPEQLNDVIDSVKQSLENNGLIVTEIVNINWGKKVKIQLGAKMAEINIFYGKRGFSTVISPRTGTNKELNELVHDYIESFLSLL